MALKLENINNLISDDLAKRNENWTEIDTTFGLKADKSTTYTKTEVDTGLGLKANKQQEEWITPTLLNGWTEYTPVRFFKDQFGIVHVKGVITGFTGTLPSNAFTFPVGYRPNQMIGFSTQANNSAVIPIYITNLGQVTIAGASKTAIFLDTISFRAEV